MSFDYQTDGSLFTITNDDSSSSTIINLSAYRLNEDVLKELYEILDESPMEVTSYTSTSVDATITESSVSISLSVSSSKASSKAPSVGSDKSFSRFSESAKAVA